MSKTTYRTVTTGNLSKACVVELDENDYLVSIKQIEPFSLSYEEIIDCQQQCASSPTINIQQS